MLLAAGVEKLFVEKTSAVGPRPGLENAIEWSREGDTLAVTDLSRISRSVPNFCRIQAQLAQRGVELRVLNIGMDTAKPSHGKYFEPHPDSTYGRRAG
ncbi:recombinase family protein [Methylobacterium iners]|uniref:DNA-invertase hin n=1 Tax=Methylobacterium iners TaxID=418707 RepID=A0ABQ4RX51_9HYPH|nr:recombinase family protein [Methylobacterium iners]GJD94777.1 DNA-invertase hin [Methylobacterium iners]